MLFHCNLCLFCFFFLLRLFSGITFGTIFLREKRTSNNNNDSNKTIATVRSSRYFSSIGNGKISKGVVYTSTVAE